MTDQYDYIVVGSGPSGSVVASRLVEEGTSTACVLEAGMRDSHPLIRVPVGFVKTLYNPVFTWPFKTEPTRHTGERAIALPQGRLVGGSSSVNGMVYARGQPADFDDWATRGNPGWGYRDVLPYFMRSERRVGDGESEYRGRAGAMPITNSDWPSDLCEAFIDGAAELGIPRNPDYNAGAQEGAGYFQRNIENGKRVSAARAFLYPAVSRGRIDLRVEAQALNIVFEGRRAVGVRYRQGGTDKIVRARREVILSCGTLNSPHLLQLSGIGPSSLLREFGIPLVHDLPGVGENLRDHYTVRLSAKARDVATLNERSKGWRLGVEIAKWMAGMPSLMAICPSLVHVYWKSRPELNRGDIQVLFTPASYKPGRVYVLDDFPGMTAGARQQRPESSGYVRLRSANALDIPAVQPNYLSDERDQAVIVAALKIARQLFRTKSLSRYFVEELMPGASIQRDDEWLDFARRTGNTAYHLVGTCRMAPSSDPTAVVDSELRVYGVEGLRVVDASIMPHVPSANTMAASLMIGEKAADLIRGRGAKAVPSRAAS